MTSRHTTGRLVTLTALAFLCGIGSAGRLPLGATGPSPSDERFGFEPSSTPEESQAAPAGATLASARAEPSPG